MLPVTPPHRNRNGIGTCHGRFIILLLSVAGCVSCQTTQKDTGYELGLPQAAEELKPYPIDTCLVSDEPLGSRNDDRVLFHEGREIKVCCAACQTAFKLSPEKYLAKLE